MVAMINLLIVEAEMRGSLLAKLRIPAVGEEDSADIEKKRRDGGLRHKVNLLFQSFALEARFPAQQKSRIPRGTRPFAKQGERTF
jgi:hypothetical protein